MLKKSIKILKKVQKKFRIMSKNKDSKISINLSKKKVHK